MLKNLFNLSILNCLLTLSAFSIYAADLLITPNDAAYPYETTPPSGTYHHFCKNIYSQNGEDGILEKILSELNIENGTFCEFGASDGISSSNTYNLMQKYNFSGMAIESDPKRFLQCQKNYKPFPNVKVFYGSVLYENTRFTLDAWLKKGGLPYDFDLLSIDIDCDDYYVWERLVNYSPKIVVIETNSYRDPIFEELPRHPSTEYNIDLLAKWYPGRIACGCSFISAVKLGLQKGYIPVAYTGNLTFIRKDLVHNLKEFPYIVSDDPYDYIDLYSHLVLWNDKWYTNTGLILNAAIRDYYKAYQQKYIDIDWINVRMSEIIFDSTLQPSS